MAGTLTFNPNDVARLIIHASQAPVRLATWGQKLEEGARMRGVDVEEVDIHEWDALVREADDLSPAPALHFVHDQGLYVMSNGRPNLPQSDPGRVIYAEGFDPSKEDFDDWWEGARAIVGGDDFVEPLTLSKDQIDASHAILDGRLNATSFRIEVTDTSLAYSFEVP